MASTLRILLLTVLVATVATAETANYAGQHCDTKSWGTTTGVSIPIEATILERNVFDYRVTIGNPCAMGKVGITAQVCDPDVPPALTIYSPDELHVHRSNPIHEAIVTGYVYCR